MGAGDLDGLPWALLAEQTELEAVYASIRDLPSGDPRVAAYAVGSLYTVSV
jgi:hypothetical protein